MLRAAIGAAVLAGCAAARPCVPGDGCRAPLACDRGACIDPTQPPSADLLAARRARLPPIADTTVLRGARGRTPLGPTDFLVVGGSDGEDAWRTYLAFDLTPLGASARVVRADLVLQARDDLPGVTKGVVTFGVHRVARPWRADLTWRSQPGAADAERAAARVPAGRRMRVRIDLRELVREWIRGVFPNRGIVLEAREEETDRRLVFHSSRTPDESLRPVLEVWTR